MFQSGQQIGSYTLIKQLGKGGFGEVWLAEKRSQFVTKKVAVKLPLDEQVDFNAIQKEAELWEQASGHANVLPIIDADVIDGQVVIVSEYADGGSLADKLKREGKLSIEKAVEMTIGILNGLEFLHNRGIIHRDIKPANILLQGDNPRLADFGISRAMQTSSISSTIIGTDSYMSPESFEGKRSIQTDIWSVGVVLYQLLVGKLPFPQENPSEKMFAILTKEFARLPDEIPQNLRRIVEKALAKLPENRYQTTTLMREDLRSFLSSLLPSTNIQNQPTAVLHAPTMPSPNFAALITDEKPSVVTVVTPDFLQPRNKVETKPFQQNKRVWLGLVAVSFLGIIVVIGAMGIYFWNNLEKPETAKIANTNQANSPTNVNKSVPNNSTPNTTSQVSVKAGEMNIQFKNTSSEKLKPVLTTTMDGVFETYTFQGDEPKIYKPKQSLKVTYSKYQSSNLQMTINGKLITLPALPLTGEGNGVNFVISKTNLSLILEKGAITTETESVGAGH